MISTLQANFEGLTRRKPKEKFNFFLQTTFSSPVRLVELVSVRKRTKRAQHDQEKMGKQEGQGEGGVERSMKQKRSARVFFFFFD